MNKTHSRGKLITFYGINNIGKSTHAKKVVNKLQAQGKKAIYLKYPVYEEEPSGIFLNSVLRGGSQLISEEEPQMWFVINRYQFQSKLEQLLQEGYYVIAEDYIATGIAWGVAKGLDEQWLETLNQYLIKEDFALLFDGQRQLRAVEENHVHEQDHDLVERCRAIFANLGHKHNWKKVEVSTRIEETESRVWEALQEILG